VVANGDIDSPHKARRVLELTGADAVMIGRAAQGRPWIFAEIDHYLATGELLPPPRTEDVRALLLEHLDDHYRFYGETVGLRTARKHIIWYTRHLEGGAAFCDAMNRIDDCAGQARAVDAFVQLAGLRPLTVSELDDLARAAWAVRAPERALEHRPHGDRVVGMHARRHRERDAARATRLTGRARRRAPGGARPLPPAVRPPWPPRHSSRPSVQQPSRAAHRA
jgi:hypothetical protein